MERVCVLRARDRDRVITYAHVHVYKGRQQWKRSRVGGHFGLGGNTPNKSPGV